jgi:hypothetical protein
MGGDGRSGADRCGASGEHHGVGLITGRAQPNVSRSLQTQADHGLVRLVREGREVRPEAIASAVKVPHLAHDPSAQTRGPAPGGRADAVPGLRREPCPACHRPCSRAVFHHGAADGNRSISARDEAPWPSSFT